MTSLEFRHQWVEPLPDEDLFGPERATFGALGVLVGGTCVTNNIRGDAASSSLAVSGPLNGIAEWLVDNWLNVLWEIHTPFAKAAYESSRVPSLIDVREGKDPTVSHPVYAQWFHRHTLGHGASDLALPTISFLPEDKVVGVFVAPPLRAYQASVRFNVAWPEPVWVPKDELSEVLSAFVTEVVARASSADASKQWGEWLAARLEDKKAAAKRDDIRLQLMLGQVAAENWEIVAKPLGAAVTALSGVLTDSEIVHSPGDLKSIAETVVDAERERAQGDRWRKVASKPADRMLLPFQRGYRLADQARAFLGLGARPLEDLREVLDGFDVALKPFHGPPLFRTAGVVSTQGRASVYYSQGEWGFTPTRFAVAAALGRLLADGPSITGAFGCAHGRQSR